MEFNEKKFLSNNERAILKNYQFTQEFLRNNKDILFTQADKGNLTVCINSEEYYKKMEDLFSDTLTYSVVKENPLIYLQEKVKLKLNNLNNKKYLNQVYHRTNTTLARAYGLVKTHKPSNPCRPIVSLVNSPTYMLAKVIYDDLKRGVKLPDSHVKNSFDLKNKIKDLKIPENYILMSLDVRALFTNVSVELVIDSLNRRASDINNLFSKITFLYSIKKFTIRFMVQQWVALSRAYTLTL